MASLDNNRDGRLVNSPHTFRDFSRKKFQGEGGNQDFLKLKGASLVLSVFVYGKDELIIALLRRGGAKPLSGGELPPCPPKKNPANMQVSQVTILTLWMC